MMNGKRYLTLAGVLLVGTCVTVFGRSFTRAGIARPAPQAASPGPKKAEEQFKIAVTADQDGSVHYKLGRVYQALGEKAKAAHEFALSTALNRESHDKLEKKTERLGEVTRSAEDP